MSSRHPPPRPPRGPRTRAAAAAAAPTTTTVAKTTPTAKRLIWTGAFAAVTIVGALYGAGLKTQEEYKAEKKQIVEATPEERIKDLEARRSQLIAQKIPLDRKLNDLQARIKAKEAQEAKEQLNAKATENKAR